MSTEISKPGDSDLSLASNLTVESRPVGIPVVGLERKPPTEPRFGKEDRILILAIAGGTSLQLYKEIAGKRHILPTTIEARVHTDPDARLFLLRFPTSVWDMLVCHAGFVFRLMSANDETNGTPCVAEDRTTHGKIFVLAAPRKDRMAVPKVIGEA